MRTLNMTSSASIRHTFLATLAAGLVFGGTFAFAQGGHNQSKSATRAQNGSARAAERSAQSGSRPQQQEHLAQWMERHSSLSLADQQKALENEPGFLQLPPETQQRMRERLTQLNNMPPEQRARIIERTEALEHLTLPQRQQVRAAMQQLGGLPVDRRRLVARAFRDLREMPPEQRSAFLASDRFHTQFSDQERATLSSLLAVEPYIPVSRPSEGVEFGK